MKSGGRTRPLRATVVAMFALAFSTVAGSAQAAPANDNVAQATVVSSAFYTTYFNTSGATLEAGELQVCPGTTIGATVWFKFQPTINMGVTADTFGSNFDTVITVIDPGSVYPCNDNAVVGAVRSKQSQVSFTAVAGQTYYFEVGGYAGATGNLKFAINKVPNNDILMEAHAIPAPSAGVTTNWSASMEKGEVPGCSGMTGSLWYKVNTFTSGNLTFETTGSNFDTTLAVWEWVPSDPGDFTQTRAGPSGFNSLGCSDDFSGLQTSRLTWVARGTDFDGRAHTYFIQVGGKNGSTGVLKYSLSQVGAVNLPSSLPATPSPVPEPVNDPVQSIPPGAGPYDLFDNAFELPKTFFAVVGDNTGATEQAGEPAWCMLPKATHWYSVTSPSHEPLLLHVRPARFNAVVHVYEQTGAGLSGLELVGCDVTPPSTFDVNDPLASRGLAVVWQAKAGVRYYIQIGGMATTPNTGPYELDLVALP